MAEIYIFQIAIEIFLVSIRRQRYDIFVLRQGPIKCNNKTQNESAIV